MVTKYYRTKIDWDKKKHIDNFKESIEKAIDDVDIASGNNSDDETKENKSIMNDCRGFKINLFGRKK